MEGIRQFLVLGAALAMKFLVEIRLIPDGRNRIVDEFERHGPNRTAGVVFRGAWIGATEDVVYALGESETEALAAEACRRWSEYGRFRIIPVVDIEQY